ncbi:hypothetical protein DPMN_069244 [Dreissena polymorpha]|uniref:Uncharacterized protein n=1 Tax=Dreissena polymorpha TaxID=45954 RepID=A0A9D3Z161_DREPO|nr:hypothetical protein DPMN_069244 [Dreissena polymorpha]
MTPTWLMTSLMTTLMQNLRVLKNGCRSVTLAIDRIRSVRHQASLLADAALL